MSTNISDKSNFIWKIADILRGDYKQHEYADVILPFTVLKRLDSVLIDTHDEVVDLNKQLTYKNKAPFLCKVSGYKFYNTSEFTFTKLKDDPNNLDENIVDYIKGFSDNAREILEAFNIYSQIERLEKEGLLYLIVSKFSDEIDLHPDRVSNTEMGYIFEELIRKFSEMSNETAGEHFTPREVIRLMVAILFDPDMDKITEPSFMAKLYDPAAGTGGFLIESFRHIYNNMARTDANLKMLREKTVYGNEITNTARITKMNMILAGDGHSNIKMKDSLANPIDGKSTYIDEKGEEHHNGYDIVLANMPYSQKTKYGNLYDLPSNNGDSICVQHCIKAVDSASENGRIALVVPEGFLFRKDLTKTREYLLENCQLQSVISLPQGVFLPYTGVKTDIIYATKVNRKISSSERRKDFWYFDVKSDGYSLDNHRRKLDTPSDLSKYEEYRKLDVDQVEDMLKVGFEVIPLDKVYKNSNILVGSRYRTHTVKKSKSHEMVKLGNIATFIRGISFPKKAQKDQADDLLNVITTRAAQADGIDFKKVVYIEKSYAKPDKMVFKGDILISLANSLELVGRVTYVDENYKDATFGAFMGVIRVNYQKVHPMYLFHILNSIEVKKYFRAVAKTTTNISNITFEDLGNLVLPLPRLDYQLKIIDELNRYQEMIVGAKKIVNNYLPKLPSYEIVVSTSLNDSELFEIISGGTPSTKNPDYWGGDISWITLADLPQEEYVTNIDKSVRTITKKGLDNSSAKMLPVGAIVVSTRATIGRVGIVKHPLATNQGFKNVIIKKPDVVIPEFLALLLKEKTEEMEFLASGATFKEISKFNFGKIKVELPSLDEQKRILLKIHEEESFVKPAKKVIEVFEHKIDTVINKVWGE